jgi:hypothetical protein
MKLRFCLPLFLAMPLPAQSSGAHPTTHVAAATINATELERVRRATEKFANADSAAVAGFAVPAATCVAHGTQGGMGFHAVNRQYLEGPLSPERPAYLVFEKLANGKMALQGVEYAVSYRASPGDSLPPTLFGQRFHKSDELKIWYLHLWAFRENPSGIFANYNPNVVCR